MSSRWRKVVKWAVATFLAVAIIALVLLFTPLGMVVDLMLYQNAGRFDRQRFETVIDEVRGLGIKPGETRTLIWEDPSDPKTLRAVKADEPRRYKPGFVWAEVTADGKLRVIIETNNMGHMGRYGFAYSESPWNSKGGTPPDHIYVPNSNLTDVEPGSRIDDHWCRVYNNDN